MNKSIEAFCDEIVQNEEQRVGGQVMLAVVTLNVNNGQVSCVSNFANEHDLIQLLVFATEQQMAGAYNTEVTTFDKGKLN